jgi:DNA-binding GntR family transcriptional regulator
LIHRGDLRPGDRISEAAIAQRLGISRGPVREAFSRLAHEGLMVHKPRSGNFIARLTPEDLDDIRDARALLESHAAARACLRMSVEKLDTLREIARALEVAARVRYWTEAASLNAKFHQTVVTFSGSTMLLRLWQAMDPLAWLLASAVPARKPHAAEDTAARHQRLIDALAAGDPQCAADAFRDHIVAASPDAGGAPRVASSFRFRDPGQ